MWDDPIVAEVRRVRAAHAAQFSHDLMAIFCDLKVQEQKSGREFVTFPARQITPVPQGPATGQTTAPVAQ